MSEEWRFVEDDDGHNYLIPNKFASLFREQLELDWDSPENEFEELFDYCRIDGVSEWVFTNPKRN